MDIYDDEDDYDRNNKYQVPVGRRRGSPRLFSPAAAFGMWLAASPTRDGSGCSSKRLVRKSRQFQHEREPGALCASLPAGDSESPQTCTC